MNRSLRAGLWLAGVFAASMGMIPIAQAESIVFTVRESVNNTGTCPKQITLNEASAPYFEGGYTIDGSADLLDVAEPMAITNSDAFSVTFSSRLRSPFRQCLATAGSLDNPTSHLRVRLINGRLSLMLDMTGMQDANGYTPSITRQLVQNGKPVWQWGGTD